MTDTTAVTPIPASNDRAPLALWDKLLAQALTKPGLVSSAYTAFHNY